MRSSTILILLSLLTVNVTCAVPDSEAVKRVEIREFRVANDKWIQRVSGHIIPYDKPVHLIVYGFFGIIGGALLAKKKKRLFWRFTLIIVLTGLLWEVKDGFVYWEVSPSIGLGPLEINIGGDGFSWKDLTANLVGYLVGLLPPIATYKLIEKRRAPK